MARDSSIPISATYEGGYVRITIPDETKETGFTSVRFPMDALVAGGVVLRYATYAVLVAANPANASVIYYIDEFQSFYKYNSPLYVPATGDYPTGALTTDFTSGIGWNAATNTPTVVSGTGNEGDFAIVSVDGTTTIDGISSWGEGDIIWWDEDNTVWRKIDNQVGQALPDIVMNGDSDLFALTTEGFYYTGPSTTNYPPSSNVLALVELRKWSNFKWLRYQRVVGGANEYWINYFDSLAWSGWKQLTFNYTPEDVANKEATTLDNSTTKYPNNNVVLTALGAKIDKVAALETWYYFSSTTGDAVGDKRHGVFSGWYIIQSCITANGTRGNGTWVTTSFEICTSLDDSNESVGAGSYIDTPNISNGGIIEIYCVNEFGGYAKVIYEKSGNPGFIQASSTFVTTNYAAGMNAIHLTVDSAKLRIINETGSSAYFTIKGMLTNYTAGGG